MSENAGRRWVRTGSAGVLVGLMCLAATTGCGTGIYEDFADTIRAHYGRPGYDYDDRAFAFGLGFGFFDDWFAPDAWYPGPGVPAFVDGGYPLFLADPFAAPGFDYFDPGDDFFYYGDEFDSWYDGSWPF